MRDPGSVLFSPLMLLSFAIFTSPSLITNLEPGVLAGDEFDPIRASVGVAALISDVSIFSVS